MYTIDGVPLSDPYRRWTVHRSTERRTPAAFRTVDVTVPGVDGSVPIYGEQVESTALNLTVNIYGKGDQLDERVNFMRGLLGKTHGPIIVSKRESGRTVTAKAKPAAISEPVSTGVYVQLTVVLTVSSGTWRGPVETWEHPDPTSTEAVATPIRSSRPITDSLILITGPANSPVVEDAATGATVQYTGNVEAGDSLLIDCAEWRAAIGSSGSVSWGTTWHNATVDIDNTGAYSDVTLLSLTPVMSGQSWDSRGEGVQIVPALGDGLAFTPRIIFRASGIDANTRVQVQAQGSLL